MRRNNSLRKNSQRNTATNKQREAERKAFKAQKEMTERQRTFLIDFKMHLILFPRKDIIKEIGEQRERRESKKIKGNISGAHFPRRSNLCPEIYITIPQTDITYTQRWHVAHTKNKTKNQSHKLTIGKVDLSHTHKTPKTHNIHNTHSEGGHCQFPCIIEQRQTKFHLPHKQRRCPKLTIKGGPAATF